MIIIINNNQLIRLNSTLIIILGKYLSNTLNEEKFHHEAVTVNSLTHDQLPTLKDIVDASHFWMSDHSRFWYHLEQGSDMFNAGAVLITDTGEYI